MFRDCHSGWRKKRRFTLVEWNTMHKVEQPDIFQNSNNVITGKLGIDTDFKDFLTIVQTLKLKQHKEIFIDDAHTLGTEMTRRASNHLFNGHLSIFPAQKQVNKTTNKYQGLELEHVQITHGHIEPLLFQHHASDIVYNSGVFAGKFANSLI